MRGGLRVSHDGDIGRFDVLGRPGGAFGRTAWRSWRLRVVHAIVPVRRACGPNWVARMSPVSGAVLPRPGQ
jgi:hypothetical protein